MEKRHRDKVCPACGKTYVSMNAAQRHLLKMHPDCTESLVILSPQAPITPSTQGPVEPKRICMLCPGLPVFVSKAAREKHTEEVHTRQVAATPPATSRVRPYLYIINCSICSVSILENTLATHLKRAHGITNSAVQVGNQKLPQPTSNSTPAESSCATSSLLTSGELVEPNRQTSAPPQDCGDSVVLDIYDLRPERFYCEEYDCGRGFSCEAYLKSHTRFFHPTKPTQIAEDATASKNHLPEVGQQPTEDSPVGLLPPSNVSSPSSEGAAWGENSSLSLETSMPILPPGGCQGTGLNAGRDIQREFESPPELPATDQGDVDVKLAVTTPALLSLQCRMCNTPPTVSSRPTATMCGHVFCSECITRHVVSTSRCPVCDSALLLYCLFKLDLPVSS